MTREVIANNPDLMSEWDTDKNNKLGLDPKKISLGSGKKAWWKCANGHEWLTQVIVRRKGHGCPVCAHIYLGENNSKLKDDSRRLTTYFPDVVKTWDYDLNKGISPDSLSYMSNKRVWWRCSNCGRKWEAPVCSRIRHKTTTCRGCSMKETKRVYLKPGINDLATVSPKAASEWDYEKNGNITPADVCANTSEQYWWKCENGHEWKAQVHTRTKDGYRGCPYCAHRRAIVGETDFATIHPELVKLWHPTKNKIKPNAVSAHSNIRYWWICDKGHEWLTSPGNMCRGTRCPYCANVKVLSGYNDLATTHPELLKEWNYEKNRKITPESITPGSGKKVWWKCNTCGHEWTAPVVARVKNHKCPVCVNRVVVKGINDLKTVNPDLAKEWNYERNGTLKPDDIIAGSPKSVWWKCENGHEWKASVASRNKGHYCPKCDASKHTSISEKAIAYYLRKSGINIEENKRINRKELDIYIPSIKTAIEYDGSYYHRDIKKDLAKNKLCDDMGIKLIRIRESGLPTLKSTSTDIVVQFKNDYTHLNEAVKELFAYLKLQFNDIDIKRDFHKVYEMFEQSEKAESIKYEFPLLAKEWDYEKNTVDIEKVSKGVHIKVWWICSECGYNYESMVYSRCSGTGCPRCANRENSKGPEKLVVGVNDLETVRPDLAKEWDKEKNEIKPTDITCGTNRKVWWRCSLGHSYDSSVSNRVKGCGCPYCVGKKVLKGFNDIFTTNPEIAKEWNYEKNKLVSPYDYTIGSSKKVWWKCSKCGKEWEAALYARRKANCASCNRKKRYI